MTLLAKQTFLQLLLGQNRKDAEPDIPANPCQTTSP